MASYSVALPTMVTSLVVAGLATAGAVIVAAVFNLYRDFVDHRRKARFAAMSAAIALERFTLSCPAFIQTNNNARQDSRIAMADPGYGGRMPSYVWLDHVGWEHLDLKLAYRLRTFEMSVEASARKVSRLGAVDWFEQVEVASAETAKLGLAAWELAAEVRARVKLPRAEFVLHEQSVLELFAQTLADREVSLKRHDAIRLAWANGKPLLPGWLQQHVDHAAAHH